MENATRMPHKTTDSGSDMLAILVQDIFRYEQLRGEDEVDGGALNNVDEGEDGTDISYITATQLQAAVSREEQPVPECQEDRKFQRFVDVTDEDTSDFIKENMNKNTMYKTRSDLKIFLDWKHANNELRDIREISPNELGGLLARFFLGIRKKDGYEYEPDTLTSIQNSIDRHVKELKLNMNIKTDPAFMHSKRVLEAKRKALKSLGKGNKNNKAEALTSEEINILHKKNILGAANPESLLDSVWLNNGMHFGMRGRQDHTNLLWGDIQLKQTSTGKKYLEFNEKSMKWGKERRP